MRTNRPVALRALSRGLISLAVVLAALAPAAAMGRGAYSLEILVDGRPLREYAARDRHYIEALEGREYSIRLTNHTSERVAVALSVDGLNTIDARVTSARDARKWILGPFATIVLDGWQTSGSTARRFFFTTEDESYGAWLGETRDLGLISAAFFREKRPRPVPIAEPFARRDDRGAGAGRLDAPAAPRDRSAPLKSQNEAGARSADSAPRAEMMPPPSDDLAATGIGRELDHRVRRVPFDAQDSPVAVAELRYEYRDALVRLGVLPRRFARGRDPLQRRERARGFDDIEFAPDPYR